MPIQLYKAKVSEVQRYGSKFLFFQIELISPNRINFNAGQYILLNVPNNEQKKAYSIASAPRLDHAIELLIELIPNGVASTYFSTLKPGDDLSFYAPAGQFFISEEVRKSNDPILFIATGSGIAPIRSMLLDLLRMDGSDRSITLYWGMRYIEDLFWIEYFQELEQSFHQFKLHLVLSKAPTEWMLCRGRVTDCLRLHEVSTSAQVFVCGNPQMIEDMKGVLSQRGLPLAQIHSEKFS